MRVPLTIEFDDADLRRLIDSVVREVLIQEQSVDAKFPGRLALTEAEAAVALGVPRHVLRDARLRGEIGARRLGKRYVYDRAGLTRWLTDRD